jgi:putative ABC transport system substrate-binding protein
MDRRIVLTWLAPLGGALALPAPAARDRPVVGRLSEGGPGNYTAFRKAMQDLGHADIEIVERYAQGQPDRLADLARQLVDLDVDVLWTTGTVATRTAKETTRTVPVVMVSADAVGGGLVDSLSRPGANLTGLTLIGTELVGKRVEMVRQLVPKLIGLIALGQGPGSETVPFVANWLQLSRAAAVSLRLDFEFAELTSDPDAWDHEIGLLARLPGRAIAVMENPFCLQNRVRLAELFTQHRVPTVFAFTEHVRAGGLLSYGVNFRYIDERVAYFVSKILRGAKPADLPVEQPTRYELAINRKTAQALGLTIPRSLLLRADAVIG